MMLRRRTMVGANSKPYDAEIEYLESSGTQYIETNIIPDADTGIEIVLTKLNNQDTYMCGLRNDSGSTRWCIGNAPYYGYGGYAGTRPQVLGIKFYVRLNYLNSKTFVVEDVPVNLPTLPFTPAYNIRLFGSAGISAGYSKWTGRMHSAKITQATSVIADFIPVRVGTTGYMYDKVSGTLYGNDGTGDFTLGNDI